MDNEAVLAYLATDEGKALIAPIIEEAKLPVVNKYKEFEQEKKTFKAKLAEYEALGDTQTLMQLIEASKKTPEQKTESSVDQGLLDTLRKQVQEKDAALNTFKDGFLKSNLDSALTDAISKQKGVPELLKGPLSNRVKAHFNDEGKVFIEVYNEAGVKQYRADESPATLDDLINEFKSNPVYGRAFEGTGANGSGTRETNARSGGVITDPKAAGYNRTKHMEYLAKKAK